MLLDDKKKKKKYSNANNEVAVLKISGELFSTDYGNTNFSKSYPNVAVKWIEKDTTQLQNDILTNNDEIDIYVWKTSSQLYQAIKRKNYVEKIENSNIIDEFVQNLHPPYFNAVTEEKSIIAIPYDLTFYNFLGYNIDVEDFLRKFVEVENMIRLE